MSAVALQRLELGELWTGEGLASAEEAGRVLELVSGARRAVAGALLLDEDRVPCGVLQLDEDLAVLDPVDLAIAGFASRPAAVVLWIGRRVPPRPELEALSYVVDRFRRSPLALLDILVACPQLPAFSLLALRPPPVAGLRGYRR